MDVASAVGVASAAITFLEFAAKLISGAVEVYESADGSMSKDTHTKQIADDFDNLSQKLQNLTIHQSPLSNDELELHRIAEQSRKTCDELRKILMGLTAGGKSKWSSIKTAWKSRRMEGDVQELHSQLRDYRSEIGLRLKIMQLGGNAQLKHELGMLRAAVQRNIRTDEEMEANIRGRILNQLSFQSISSRRDNISKPETGTLDWIIDNPEDYEEDQASHDVPDKFILQQKEAREEARNQYLSWLKGGGQSRGSSLSSAPTSTPASSVLFIAGKAGSGKSTLMHRLFEHTQSHPDTLAWANNRKIVFLSFYFWVASNDLLQMTAEGLYRGVLYSVVDQHPELCPVLFPVQWQAIRDRIRHKIEDPSGKLDGTQFSSKALRVACERIFDKASTLARHYCFCLFLDGLDEYRATSNYGKKRVLNAQESGREIARAVLQWSNAEHVRICCSARPHAEFELLISKATTLRLENVNLCDIYRYCKQTFEKDDEFGNFGDRSRSLADTLTTRCKGVFLWALLTVKILIPALERGASDAELETKLTATPDGIDALYDELLSQVDRTDREQSDRLLILVLEAQANLDEFPACWVLWIDEVLDANKPLGDCLENHEPDRFEISKMKARLKINQLTRGLLESHKYSVDLFHRTAYDYVRERYDNGQLRSDLLGFQDNGVYARLRIAQYVHLHHKLENALQGIRACHEEDDEDAHRRSLMFLADSIALGIRQRRHLFPGKDLCYMFPACRITNFSREVTSACAYALNEDKDRPPVLAGTTVFGYIYGIFVLFPEHHPFASDSGIHSSLTSGDLLGAILSYTFSSPFAFTWAILRILEKNEPLSSFLNGEVDSGLPYPPWMFLTACIINNANEHSIDVDSDGRCPKFDESGKPIEKYKLIEKFENVLRQIIPPEAQHDGVITLHKVAARQFPVLEKLLAVRIVDDVDEAGSEDDVDGASTENDIYGLVDSIEYRGHRVDRETSFLIMCPGLHEEM